MSNETAKTQTINIVPVQGIFTPNADLVTLVGPGGVPFAPAISPIQTGITLINSHFTGGDINGATIGAVTPSTGVFTDIQTTTGRVLTDPVNQYDMVNKAYVDLIAAGGLIVRAAVACATTANLTSLSGLPVIDGYQTIAGDRVLVKDQTSAQFNGVYVAAVGTWSRSTDMDTWAEINNSYVFVNNGTVNQLSSYVAYAPFGGTIDVTPIVWNIFSASKTYSAGNGLALNSGVFSVVANGTSLNVSSSGVKISDTYAGQTSITTLGTIATGTWNGSTIDVLHGGTGATTASGARTNLGAAASGANADITSMSGLSGAIASPLSIQFGNGSAVTLAAGKMWYNNVTGSLNFGMGGGNITQQVGEEIFIYGKASAAITEGQLICKTGVVGASGVITFAPSPTGLTDNDGIIGVATENIPLNGFGRITAFGVVHGINTSGSSVGETWVDGDTLWYNPSYVGGMTKVKPTAPNIKFQIATVINAGNGGSGSLQVLLVAGSQLGGTDSNVQFGTLATNNLIQYNGTYWTNITPASLTGVGSVANSVTFNNSGTGDASGASFNGSAVKTVSYNTIGAPKADGTGASGTWGISISGNAATATSATTATTSTNLAGGLANQIAYQTGAGATSFLTAPTVADTYLRWTGSAFAWTANASGTTISDDTTTNATRYPLFADVTTGSVTTEYTSSTKLQFNPSTGALTATSLTPTNALGIAYGGTGATTAGAALTALGAYPASNPSGYTSNTGTVTSVGGTGTVNGLTLTGTVTSSGNLTLGGTLDLSSPPAIGGSSPNTGTFTTVSDSLGNVRNIPQSGSAKTTSYTLATTDNGQFIQISTGGSITIPNSTFSAGQVVSLFNNTGGTITVTCSIASAYIGGTDGAKASVTLAARGLATILFISGTVCVINGNVS